MTQVKTAVVGVGAFGEHHARVLNSSGAAELVAVVDSNQERAHAVAEKFGCQALTSIDELVGRVQAVSLVAPTALHSELGVALLQSGIDVLVEKPVAPSLEAADSLIAAANKNGRILQVGHLERFNPVVEAAKEQATLPLFFEVHRMSLFSKRSLDIDVVLDLMIHDLDIILSMVDSPITRLEATGLAVLSSKPDISSVRIVFENGCVANLTASRASVEKIRKLRFFQPRQYISIDYTRQDGVICAVNEQQKIAFRQLPVTKGEPLVRQIESFLECVQTRKQPRVTGQQARNALGIALRIREEMERHGRIVTATLAAHDQ
jgi:predicted dehydrogenase